jgi:hypothetical protein
MSNRPETTQAPKPNASRRYSAESRTYRKHPEKESRMSEPPISGSLAEQSRAWLAEVEAALDLTGEEMASVDSSDVAWANRVNAARSRGNGLVAAVEAQWRERAANERLVVSTYGAFNTGKSALLRRLLVDDDQPVPESLIIAGAPETATNTDMDALGVTLRDAPGLQPGAEDDRGQHHNVMAAEAVADSDAVLLMFNPQLPTAERDEVRALIAEPWPVGALIPVIARFDEAGTDPEDSPTGYRDLAERKRSELRHALGLNPDVTVHVIAQDPFGIAGKSRQPDESVWDPYRGWDGVESLAKAVAALPLEREGVRAGACDRFWVRNARTVKSQVETATAEYRRELEFALNENNRAISRSGELQSLRESEEGNLARFVDDTVRDLALSGERTDPEDTKALVAEGLASWLNEVAEGINAFLSGIELDTEVQVTRPAFARFEVFLDGLMSDPASSEESVEAPAPAPGGARGSQTRQQDLVDKTLKALRGGLKAYVESESGMSVADLRKSVRAPRSSVRSTIRGSSTATAASSAGDLSGVASRGVRGRASSHRPSPASLLTFITVLDEVAPLVQEIHGLLTSNKASQAQAEAQAKRREELRAKQREASSRAADFAWVDAESMFEEAAASINSANPSVSGLVPALSKVIDRLEGVLEDFPL